MGSDALENMKGAAFKAAVAAADARWSEALQHLPRAHLASWRAAMRRFQDAAFPETRDHAHIQFQWQGHAVSIQDGSAGYTTNVWIGAAFHLAAIAAIGFAPTAPFFYTLADIGSGSEHLEITVWEWKAGTTKPHRLWSRAPVGPAIVLTDTAVYFSSVENMLRYPDVRRVSVATGRQERRLFHESDKRIQVTLMHRDDAIFVHCANALEQRLGRIVGDAVTWMTPVLHTTLVPVTQDTYATNTGLVVLGATKTEIPFPAAAGFLQDACKGPLPGTALVTCVRDGQTSLWFLDQQAWRCLWRPEGAELSDIHIYHEPTAFPTFLLRRPSAADAVWVFKPSATGIWRLTCDHTYPEPLRLRVLAAGCVGTTDVPYTVVCSGAKKPRALLVEGYGAYGISARRAYPIRWLPWIAAGYAVAYVCPRGGREKGDAWYDGGRTAPRKHHTFEDTAAAIRGIQRRLRIGPAATVFFGRSAGGWLAANIAQDHGSLVAGVYAEVPYVDVLRTASNPRLPLTVLEYDEFGDPVHRPADRAALTKISPVDTVPAGDATSPTLVIRTGLHDAQVFPYEALKWSRRLREQGWPSVHVGIDHDGGHFAGREAMIQQRAEDAALLDYAVLQNRKASRKRATKRSSSRSGIAGAAKTRRARSSR